MLNSVKLAMQITVSNYDAELQLLIDAALKDLKIAGSVDALTPAAASEDPLIIRAVITYCRMHFGSPLDYDRLKASYDEQKAQLQMATGYTSWGDEVAEDGDGDDDGEG